MDSLESKCNARKWEYEKCFHAWFADSFLAGKKDSDPCTHLLVAYQHCLTPKLRELGVETDLSKEPNTSIHKRLSETLDNLK